MTTRNISVKSTKYKNLLNKTYFFFIRSSKQFKDCTFVIKNIFLAKKAYFFFSGLPVFCAFFAQLYNARCTKKFDREVLVKYGNESKVNPPLITQEKIGVLHSLSFNSVLPAASHLQMINTFLLLPPISLLDLSSLTQQFAMALDFSQNLFRSGLWGQQS